MVFNTESFLGVAIKHKSTELDRQEGRQSDRQTDRQVDRQIDRQIDRYKYNLFLPDLKTQQQQQNTTRNG